MASKLSRRLITLSSAIALVGGCTQILGISDYEVDPKLDHPTSAGGDGNANGGDNGTPTGTAGTKPSTAGTKNEGGSPNGGQPSSEAGSPDQPTAGSPAGDAGAAGAAPTGTIVQCDSAECCTGKGGKAVGVELLKDGGFELGPDGSPWKEISTTASNELIFGDLTLGFMPKTGSWFAYLSGIADEESTIYQLPVVPKDAGWLVVSGWRYFQVDSQDDINADFAGIGFYAYPSGDTLEIPAFWSAPPAQDGWGNARKWTHFEYSFDALPHQGLKRELDFRGSSDSYSTDPDLSSSSYLFDDVSLMAFNCRK